MYNQKKIREEAKKIMERLKIIIPLDIILSYKKTYIYMNNNTKVFRIQSNKVVSGNQVKVQIYNFKKYSRYDIKDAGLNQIYIDSMKLCSLIEELKLIEKIENENEFRNNLTYQNQLISFKL